jgi:hypothetical protein
MEREAEMSSSDKVLRIMGRLGDVGEFHLVCSAGSWRVNSNNTKCFDETGTVVTLALGTSGWHTTAEAAATAIWNIASQLLVVTGNRAYVRWKEDERRWIPVSIERQNSGFSWKWEQDVARLKEQVEYYKNAYARKLEDERVLLQQLAQLLKSDQQ